MSSKVGPPDDRPRRPLGAASSPAKNVRKKSENSPPPDVRNS
jgi:hypothetical protein